MFRFTDWSQEVTLNGEAYTPTDGFRSSAEEGIDGLTPGNRELIGVLSATAITDDDLRAGLYRRAVINEYVVDPRFPWLGAFRQNLWTIQEVKFNQDRWDVQVDGPLTKLRATKGYTYERKCRWENFGDADCGFSLASVTVSGAAVVAVTEGYKEFTSDVPTGNGDHYYREGRITWLTGENAGLIADVKAYTEVAGLLRLHVEAKYAINAGDTFDLVPGCDRQFSTCVAFGNKDNFGGAPYIPGNNDLFTTPDAKAQEDE